MTHVRVMPISPSSQRHQPGMMTERRANCTHTSMVILHGPYRCSACNHQGGFGAVYRCSQDHPEPVSGLLSREDEVARIDHIVRNGTPRTTSVFEPSPSFSPEHRPAGNWPPLEFKQNILESTYNLEQQDILKRQKLRVQATLKDSKRYPRNFNTPLKPIFANSIIASSPSTAIDKISQDVSSASYANSSRQAIFKHFPTEAQPTTCRMKICHSCRVNYIERAWGRIDAIALLDPALLPSNLPSEVSMLFHHVNISGPGISPVHIVRNIGTRQPPQILATFPDTDLEISTSSSSQRSTNSSESDRSHRGFRQNLTRAFRGMMMSRKRSNGSMRRPRSLYKADGALSLVSEEELERGDDADITLWEKLDEENLRLAAAVPLPELDNEEISGEFGSGEVVLVDGIAVTEEAVGERVADVTIL